MSTRSVIAVEYETGMVEANYCHSDGYPSGVGVVLAEHYAPYPSKLEALIGLGSLSCLGEEIGEKHDFDKHYGEWKTPEWGGPDTPGGKGWCRVYHRDRGEEWDYVKPVRYETVEAFEADMTNPDGTFSWCEWVYLIRDGKISVMLIGSYYGREGKYLPYAHRWMTLPEALRAYGEHLISGDYPDIQKEMFDLAEKWENRLGTEVAA